MHSVGTPLEPGQKDVPWPCNPDKVHRAFPGDARDLVLRLAATAATRCWARNASRCASPRYMARDEGWMAEHMLILGVEDPAGREDLRRRRVPQRLRQDQFRHADSARGHSRAGRSGPSATTSPGSSPDADGRLRAINPEAGFFGVAPGTSRQDQPQCHGHACRANTIFTNVALTPDGGVWWEGMTDEPPGRVPRLAGQALDARDRETGAKAAHPNAPLHRAGPRSARPSIPTGKTRRACRSAPSSSAAAAPRPCRWSTRPSTGAHGVYVGATMGSETTAAAAGAVGKVRRDPMAMLPFCGYHMGDYFRPLAPDAAARFSRPPRIFHVNWFRKDKDGQFLWPGFGENMRVLKWIVDRANNHGQGHREPSRLDAALRGPLLGWAA